MLQLTGKNMFADELDERQQHDVAELDSLLKNVVQNYTTGLRAHKTKRTGAERRATRGTRSSTVDMILKMLCAHGYLQMGSGDMPIIQKKFHAGNTKRIWVSNENGTITFLQALNFFKKTALMGDLCGSETMQQLCETTAVPFVFGKHIMLGEVLRIAQTVQNSIEKRLRLAPRHMSMVIKRLCASMTQAGELLIKKAESGVIANTSWAESQETFVYGRDLRLVVVGEIWHEITNVLCQREVRPEYHQLLSAMLNSWGSQTQQWSPRADIAEANPGHWRGFSMSSTHLDALVPHVAGRTGACSELDYHALRRPHTLQSQMHLSSKQTAYDAHPASGKTKAPSQHTCTDARDQRTDWHCPPAHELRSTMAAIVARTGQERFEMECRAMITNVMGVSPGLHEMCVCTQDEIQSIQHDMKFMLSGLSMTHLYENVKHFEIYNTGVHLLRHTEPTLFPNKRPTGGYKLPAEVFGICENIRHKLYNNIPPADARFETIQNLRIGIVVDLLHFFL